MLRSFLFLLMSNLLLLAISHTGWFIGKPSDASTDKLGTPLCNMLFTWNYFRTSDIRLASFPGPRPAFRRLQYGKAGEGLVHFLT